MAGIDHQHVPIKAAQSLTADHVRQVREMAEQFKKFGKQLSEGLAAGVVAMEPVRDVLEDWVALTVPDVDRRWPLTTSFDAYIQNEVYDVIPYDQYRRYRFPNGVEVDLCLMADEDKKHTSSKFIYADSNDRDPEPMFSRSDVEKFLSVEMARENHIP